MRSIKFFCTHCGKDLTDDFRELVEQRCRAHAIDPRDLGQKAGEVAKIEMLRELGEKPPDTGELAFITATALLLLEWAYAPELLCDECRSPRAVKTTNEKVRLRLIKGNKAERE